MTTARDPAPSPSPSRAPAATVRDPGAPEPAPGDAARVQDVWAATLAATRLDAGAPVDPGATLRPPDAVATRADGSRAGAGAPPGALDLPARELVLGERLGQGGMGVVYHAVQPALGREVAVKMLAPASRRQPEHVAAFVAEARVTARLDHPNVVPIYSLTRDDAGDLLLGMKRIEGRSWAALLGAEPPGPDTLRRHLDVLRRVLDAVAFAHERGVVHRDLKPANVMVGSHGQVYLLDWGLAVEVGQAGKIDAPSSGGTPAYMAPEMADGASLSRATDVYLLGAILHELLVGRPPHRGGSLINVIAAALRNDVLPLRPAFAAPPGLVEVAARCLATSPADRYPSAAELRAALDHVLSGEQQRGEAEALAGQAAAALDALPPPSGLSRAAAAELYGRLFDVDALVQTALQRWAECPRALDLRGRLHVALVRCALAAGDLALAARFLERARALGVPGADELASEVGRARLEADPAHVVAFAEATRRGRLVAGAGALCCAYVALFGLLLHVAGPGLDPAGFLVPFAAWFGPSGVLLHGPSYLLCRGLKPRRRAAYGAAVGLAAAAALWSVALLLYTARATRGSELWWLSIPACLPLAGTLSVLAGLADARVRALFPAE